MTALDFMMICVGLGIFLVCCAHAVKTLGAVMVKSTTRVARDLTHHNKDEPLDPLSRQLHEFRNTRFGRDMAAVPVRRSPAETWPVMRPRMPPPSQQTNDKKDTKERRGK